MAATEARQVLDPGAPLAPEVRNLLASAFAEAMATVPVGEEAAHAGRVCQAVFQACKDRLGPPFALILAILAMARPLLGEAPPERRPDPDLEEAVRRASEAFYGGGMATAAAPTVISEDDAEWVIPIGKFRGATVGDVLAEPGGRDYLAWVAHEMHPHGKAAEAFQAVARRVVAAGGGREGGEAA